MTLLLVLAPALFGLHILTLKVNDLNPDVNRLCKEQMDEDELHVGYFFAWRDYFKIPLVKRATSFLFSIFFAAVQVAVYFQRQCGTLNASHFLLAAWILGLVLEEVQQLRGLALVQVIVCIVQHRVERAVRGHPRFCASGMSFKFTLALLFHG